MISGFSFPVVEFEYQKTFLHPFKFSATEDQAVDEEIQKLLAKGAIIECDEILSGDFVSTVFLRPKKK